MARKSVKEMRNEIMLTDAYVNEGKIIKIDARADAKRIVYTNVNSISNYDSALFLMTDDGNKVVHYVEEDVINGIPCKK